MAILCFFDHPFSCLFGIELSPKNEIEELKTMRVLFAIMFLKPLLLPIMDK